MPAPQKKVYNARSGLQGSIASEEIFSSVAQGIFFLRRCGKKNPSLILFATALRVLSLVFTIAAQVIARIKIGK